MSIISPIDNLSEAALLLEAGADELYVWCPLSPECLLLSGILRWGVV